MRNPHSLRIRPAIRSVSLLGTVLLAACATTSLGLEDVSNADHSADSRASDAARNGDAATVFDAGPSFDAMTGTDGDVPFDAFTGFDATTGTDANFGTDSSAPDVTTVRDSGVTPPTTPTSALLLDGADPMPCADPTVFSENDAEATFYVYCTGMSHVWRTSDWVHFSDQRSATRFDLTGLSANGQHIGAWWAPGIAWAPNLNRYVMWVSVPAAAATNGADGWSARAFAVLTSPTPTGVWNYVGMGQTAGAGQHFIDPFLFRDHDGRRYVFWKQYGGGVPSRIMGAQIDATWRSIVAGTRVEIMDGFGGAGTWEDNVRENPAVWYDAGANRYHMLFSGGHWAEDNYATAHALSTCGPLCVSGTGNWHMVNSGDRGILQTVRTFNHPSFAFGGPGGAEFQDRTARHIIYAAAARSGRGDHTRYLMRDRVAWQNGAPFVDTAGHNPLGY